MEPSTRSWLRRTATLSLAAACAATVAMVIAKLLCILSVLGAETGGEWLSRELSVSAVPAWFTQDLLAGVAVGALVGLAFGVPRRPGPRRVARVVLALALAALALLLAVTVYVYELFGVPPSPELWHALEGGGAAKDSILSFIGPGAIAMVIGLAAVLIVGTLGLEAVFARRRRVTMLAGAHLIGAAVLAMLAGFVAPASALALDRNVLIEIAASPLRDDEPEELPPPAEFARVLERVALRSSADAPPMVAYRLLRNWARRERPNVVVVILESTATNYMHVTGGHADNTPHLDRIAKRSIFWRRHYSHQPRSMSSIYSILCSNFIRPFKKTISYTRPRIDCRSLPEVLTARGYRAGLFHSGTFAYTHKLYFLADRGYEVLLDGITLPGSGTKYERWGWGLEEAGAVDALVAWAAEDRDEPFFATYIPVYPHHPYPVPREEFETSDDQGSAGKYVDSMRYVDHEIGRLMEGLDEAGVTDDTLFLFVGDHGEAFGEHPGSKAHGGKLYDEQVRTFALWYAPGLFDRQYVDDRPFGHVDLAPTLLAMLDIEPQPQHVGRSADLPGERMMIPLYLPPAFHGLGLVDGDWKYIYDRKTRQSELYNLIADPKETDDVHSLHTTRTRSYQRRVLQFMSAQKQWEKGLPDLPPTRTHRPPPDRRAALTWTFTPATCRFDAEQFRIVETGLQPTHKRRSETVICEQALPPVSGRITRMEIRGEEQMTRGNITATLVWERPDGVRTPLAFGSLNGSKKKPQRTSVVGLRPEMTAFGPGGRLILELTFKYRGAASKFTPDLFRVDEVQVWLEHDGKALQDALRALQSTINTSRSGRRGGGGGGGQEGARTTIFGCPLWPTIVLTCGRIWSSSIAWLRNDAEMPCRHAVSSTRCMACPARTQSAGVSPSVPSTTSSGDPVASSWSRAATASPRSKVRTSSGAA